MSYILDALRRADSEREREAVPGLHTQQMYAPSESRAGKSWWMRPWAWIGAGVCGGLLVAGVWRWMFSPESPPRVAMVPAPPVVVEPVPSPVPAPPPPPPPVAAAKPPAPRPVAKQQQEDEGGRVYTLNELPADIRRELPALAVGGSSYSESPSSRLLILNGQIFREGDKLATDLKLERIQLKSAILRFKEYRLILTY